MIPLLIRLMDRAITLNHQSGFTAKEISDVVAKLVLSSKLEPM
jgi:hypothetical protein